MWIYIVNLALLIINNFIFKNKKTYTIISSIQLFLILALRNSNLGVDLENYSGGYYYISNLSLSDMISRLNFFKPGELIHPYSYESGYIVFNWIVSKLNFSFHGFLVICAFINIFSFGKFIYKYSEDKFLSFLILCTFGTYSNCFGIIRQSLALSIFLWSIDYLIKNKKNKAFILFVISFMFHRSILILLPLIMIYKIEKINKKNIVSLMLLTVPFFLLSGKIYLIVQWLMQLLGKGYVGKGFTYNNLIILLYVVSLLVLIFIKDLKNLNKIDIIAIYALLFSIFVEIIGMYNENFARCVTMYNFFLIISIPCVISKYNKEKSILLVKIVLVILLTIFYIKTLHGSLLVPYSVVKNNILFNKI